MRLGGHVARVEVQAGDGVGALGALGLLLDGDGPPLAVELHDAEALGVVPRGRPKTVARPDSAFWTARVRWRERPLP